MAAVDRTSLMDIVKGLMSEITIKILSKRGLCSSHHNFTVFCGRTSAHGDLLLRKEFLMSVLKERYNADQQQLKEFTDDIVQDLVKAVTSSKELSCYFSEIVHSSLGHINIKLHRQQCFAVCIEEVVKTKNNYGSLPYTGQQVCLFAHDLSITDHGVNSCNEEHYCMEFHQLWDHPVAKARGVLMASLLYNLLVAVGFNVTRCANVPHCNHEILLESLLCAPKDLPYICEQTASLYSIDVSSYLSAKNLIGRGGYSNAINKITVRNQIGITKIGYTTLDIIKAVPDHQATSNTKVIHIVHCKGSHDVEKAIAVSLVARGIELQHHILTHSGVDKAELVFSQLLKNREQSSMEACRVRYSNNIPDAQLRHISSRVAEAAIKFDLLMVDPKCQVKCCLSDSIDKRSSGSFVLYNYARISTIMERFEDAIKKGTYSPLPQVSAIDFSLLADQSEWVLLFQYIAVYPNILQEISKLDKQGLGLYVTSTVKKLCIFLIHLTREFSSYYSRVKILLEPQPHLLPLMYARVGLVSCVKQVLHNGLKLLAIEPVTQI